MNVSVAFKLTVARFVNSSLVLLMVNETPKTWFKGGDLVYDAQILIIILALQGPFMMFLDLAGRFRKFKINKEIAKGDDCTLTQREANTLCEGG
jgi:hypothetical protein